MLNSQKNSEDLESLLDVIEPEQAVETLRTMFAGYITTADYCQLPEVERHNIVFAGKSIIDFFNHINKQKIAG